MLQSGIVVLYRSGGRHAPERYSKYYTALEGGMLQSGIVVLYRSGGRHASERYSSTIPLWRAACSRAV